MSDKSTAPAKRDPKTLELAIGPNETQEDALGRAMADPAVMAVSAMQFYQGNLLETASLTGTMGQINQITARVKGGDLSDIEGMLVAQATALQAMFASLARRAQVQTAQRNLEAFLGLALKAQSASRATLSALVDLKFPRTTVIAEQANVATAGGNQQVNNGVNPERPAQAPAPGRRGSRVAKTQLLERSNGQPSSWMDTRAKSKAA